MNRRYDPLFPATTVLTMALHPNMRPVIDISSLPDISRDEHEFHDTSFFQSQAGRTVHLPSPTEVLREHPNLSNGVAIYEDLNLVVKFDDLRFLRREEAQALRAIRQAFPDGEVPVPEVFGWKVCGHRMFLYMSLIVGKTLREAWPLLTKHDKIAISTELSHIVTALRRVSPDPSGPFIGSVSRGPVQDRFFHFDHVEGPFLTIKSFQDWLLAAATRQQVRPGEEVVVLDGLYRDWLPDTGNICLTHGDLTIDNIIISSDEHGAYHIAGIIDWEQAGWYPEYWEYFKLYYGVEIDHKWRTEGWADKVMKPFEDEFTAVAEYFLWRNP
ncbi:kinase-like domain-containing protein [Hypoxylon argillaceum]|nr:kinase-like domain-containing protein [Hypoxylon argillaceum]